MVHLKSRNDDLRKANRLQVRIDTEAYSILEKAVHYRYGSLSKLIREASLKEAKRIIREHGTMALSDQDWSFFMEALSSPQQPNEALKIAYKTYTTTLQK